MTITHSRPVQVQELAAFHAILSNGSISAAAEALGISQSAVSKQLKTLREYFGDELFVRSGRGMAATNRALALAPQISNLLTSFEALHGEIDFDPSNLERDFVISTTDEIQHVLLNQLIAQIGPASPGSRIIFRVLDRDHAAKQLESGSVDIAISPNWRVPEHLHQKRLFSDDFVVLFREGHPLQDRTLTLKRYLDASHMMVSPVGNTSGPIDELLHANGQDRFVSLTTPYFMQVADALCGSDLILTLQRKTCETLVSKYPLVTAEVPLRLQAVHYYLYWHKRYDKDSSNRWLRQVCCDILRSD